jgi:hypothetical protein
MSLFRLSRGKLAFAQRSGAMKAPVGFLSNGTVLRSKMEGLRPDKFRFAQSCWTKKPTISCQKSLVFVCGPTSFGFDHNFDHNANDFIWSN